MLAEKTSPANDPWSLGSGRLCQVFTRLSQSCAGDVVVDVPVVGIDVPVVGIEDGHLDAVGGKDVPAGAPDPADQPDSLDAFVAIH